MQERKSCHLKQKMRRKLHRRYSRRIRNQNWEHFANLCELNLLKTQVNLSEFFPVENINIIKIKITHNRVVGVGYI